MTLQFIKYACMFTSGITQAWTEANKHFHDMYYQYTASRSELLKVSASASGERQVHTSLRQMEKLRRGEVIKVWRGVHLFHLVERWQANQCDAWWLWPRSADARHSQSRFWSGSNCQTCIYAQLKDTAILTLGRQSHLKPRRQQNSPHLRCQHFTFLTGPAKTWLLAPNSLVLRLVSDLRSFERFWVFFLGFHVGLALDCCVLGLFEM